MKPDLTKSSPAERAETIDALCSKLRWLAEILTGRRQFNSRVSDTELTGVVEAMQQAADLLVSLQGQQASLDGELQEFGNRLAASQRPLPPDAAKLLNEHAFELYAGQQASREQERERQPSAWSEFGDGHDYSRTGRHDPLNCRLCLRSGRIAKLEAAEQQIKTLVQERDEAKANFLKATHQAFEAMRMLKVAEQERDALREEIQRLKGEQR
jgi:hypothetical protein